MPSILIKNNDMNWPKSKFFQTCIRNVVDFLGIKKELNLLNYDNKEKHKRALQCSI